MAQQQAPLFPLHHAVDALYVLQIELYGIDGARAGLTQDRGFRRFVARHCTDFGLSGFVWRTPRVNGKVLARGTEAQLDTLLGFVEELRLNEFIYGYTIQRGMQDFHISSPAFVVKPSNRHHAITGVYFDDALDDVASNYSSDSAQVHG